MALRVGISGFGRIGRQVVRIAEGRAPGLEIVAVNGHHVKSEGGKFLRWLRDGKTSCLRAVVV